MLSTKKYSINHSFNRVEDEKQGTSFRIYIILVFCLFSQPPKNYKNIFTTNHSQAKNLKRNAI